MRDSFTLIEIIIIVAIIGIGLIGGIAAFNTLGQSKTLDYEAKRLSDFISIYQKKSFSPPTCSTGEFKGYQINIASGSYSAEVCCGASGVDPISPTDLCTTQVDYKTVSSSNISMNAGYVLYYPLGSGARISLTGNKIAVRNSATSQCIDINFSSNGLITTDSPESC